LFRGGRKKGEDSFVPQKSGVDDFPSLEEGWIEKGGGKPIFKKNQGGGRESEPNSLRPAI